MTVKASPGNLLPLRTPYSIRNFRETTLGQLFHISLSRHTATYNPKELKLSSKWHRWRVLSSALPVVSMTVDEVGAPARLSDGPSPSTNIPVVHTLLMAIQSPRSLFKGMRRIGRLQRSFSSKDRPNWPSSSSVRAILPYAKRTYF